MRTLQIVSLAEQAELRKRDKDIARFNKRKSKFCNICKCEVYLGINSFTERTNLAEHKAGARHQKALDNFNTSWIKCDYCPEKTFSCKLDRNNHDQGKKHKASVLRFNRLNFIGEKA